MNKWLFEKRKEAFVPYKKHVAMFLHFKPESAYSFPRYNGTTSVSMESFMRKDPKFIQKYVILNHHTKNLDLERFLFANYIDGDSHIDHLNSKYSIEKYEIWSKRYGTSANFENSCHRQYRQYIDNSNVSVTSDLSLSNLHHIIDSNILRLDDPELILWGIRFHPETEKQLSDVNVLYEQMFRRLRKIEEFYIWYGIINHR